MLERRILNCAGVLILALALLPTAAYAQDQQKCDDQAAPTSDSKTAVVKVTTLELAGCLGGAKDNSALAKQVRGFLKPAIGAEAPKQSALVEGLRLLQARADLLSNGGADRVFTELATQVAAVSKLLGTGKSPAVPTVWRYTAGTVSALSAALPTSLEETVDTACVKASPECTAAFDRAREVLRIAGLTRQIVNLSVAAVFVAHLEATTTRLKQWGAYFDTARSQYPWELLINGKAMGDDRKVVDGVKQGFRSVPSYQFIVLHPTISFEYDKTQPKGEQLNAAAVVDIFGANKWTWKEDGSMGTALGATIIASIGDKASGNNISWGAMVHVNHKYSVGFTRRTGEWTVLVSGDFPKIWAKVPQSIRDRIAGGGQ